MSTPATNGRHDEPLDLAGLPNPFDPGGELGPTPGEIRALDRIRAGEPVPPAAPADARPVHSRSRSSRRAGAVNVPAPPVRAVCVGTLAEPPPREWFVAGLVPAGAPAILAGHSGLGKSYIALCIAICVCTGRAFLGRDVKQAPALWVDRELDQDEMARRSYAVARGMGLEGPPANLFYLRPLDAIGTGAAQAEILAAIEEHGIELTILDSLTLGAVGDAKEQRDVVPVMRDVEAWGTSLCIDHITKAAAAGNQSSAGIFGSGMKRAIARSTFNLVPAGNALTLHPDKSNFGPASTPVHFVAGHGVNEDGKQEVVFRKIEADDEALAGAGDHAPAHEQTLIALIRLFHEAGAPVPLSTLAAERDVKEGTLRNHLAKLGARVVRHGDNTYSPAEPKEPYDRAPRSRHRSSDEPAVNGIVNGAAEGDPWGAASDA